METYGVGPQLDSDTGTRMQARPQVCCPSDDEDDADGPAMLDQYGNKRTLCTGLAQLPNHPTDE